MAEKPPKSQSVKERNPLLAEISIFDYKPKTQTDADVSAQEARSERSTAADKST
jgi:hypothetical protein